MKWEDTIYLLAQNLSSKQTYNMQQKSDDAKVHHGKEG